MKPSLTVLALGLVAVCYVATCAEAKTLQDSTVNSPGRRNYRRARQPSPILGELVPSGPPVKMSNGHTGVIPLASRQALSRSRHERSRSRSNSKFEKKPVVAVSSSPRKMRRRMRRRRPTARKAPIGKQLARQKRRRQPVQAQTIVEVQEPVEEKPSYRFARKIVEGMLSTSMNGGARLIGARGNYGAVPLVDKLIDNATLIRPNLVEGFDCTGLNYGYYADQLNDCQVFHVCVNMQQIFPGLYTDRDTYHFSFICPEHTIFSQDSMVCVWERSAVPCSEAHKLYYMNKNFFVVSNDDQDVKKTTSPAGGYPAPSSGGYPAPSPGSYPPSSAGSYPAPSQTGYPAQPSTGYSTQSPSGYPTQGTSSPNTYPTAKPEGPLPDSFVVDEPEPPLPGSVLIISDPESTPSAGYPTPSATNPPPSSASYPSPAPAPASYPSPAPAIYPSPAPAPAPASYPSPALISNPPPTHSDGSASVETTIGGGSYPTPGGATGVPGPLPGSTLIERSEAAETDAETGPLPDSVQIR